MRTALSIAAVAALLLAGCGDSDDDARETTAPDTTATATAPAEPPEQVVTVPEGDTPPVTVTEPAPAPTAPEEAPGGAGDEEGIHVPARFTLQPGGKLTPESVEVPAFLGTAVVVDNQDSAAHRLEVGDRGASLPAGRTTTLNLPGRAAVDLPVLVEKIAAIPGITDVGLTTNGLLLAPLARALRDAGLERINVSLDTMDPAKFRELTRRTGFEQVIEGSDLKVHRSLRPHLARLLWLFQMGVIFFWIHDHSPAQARTRRVVEASLVVLTRLLSLTAARLPGVGKLVSLAVAVLEELAFWEGAPVGEGEA